MPVPVKKKMLKPGNIRTEANGQNELVIARDLHIYAEFQGSCALKQRLRESLYA